MKNKDKDMRNKKIAHMHKRTRLEQIILDLERMDMSPKIKRQLELLKIEIKDLVARAPRDDHKLYLTDIIDKEKPVFGSNNLILAPVGSGKSTLIETRLLDGFKGKALMLVSNRFLKDDVCPDNNNIRKERALNNKSEMMFTTKNQTMYGEKDYEMHVMTYHEFGIRIQNNNKFMEDITQVYCDEIHSLPEYKNFSKKGVRNDSNEPLVHAIKYLFSKQEDKQIFYFTATNSNLEELKLMQPNLMDDVVTFDYRSHPDIKKYMSLSKSYINHIEQIRPFLRDRIESFDYFRSKGLAFARTITGLKIIEKILIEEGYNPLVLWSDANTKHKLTEEQVEARRELISTNKIPEGYNFLVINGAMREGWDLKDPRLRLVIMNTTNETDSIQARGRVRKDVDLLIYRSNNFVEQSSELKIDPKYLNTRLTTEMKDELCEHLNLRGTDGKLSKWRKIKSLLLEQGYDVKEGQKTVDGKRVKVSTIQSPVH